MVGGLVMDVDELLVALEALLPFRFLALSAVTLGEANRRRDTANRDQIGLGHVGASAVTLRTESISSLTVLPHPPLHALDAVVDEKCFTQIDGLDQGILDRNRLEIGDPALRVHDELETRELVCCSVGHMTRADIPEELRRGQSSALSRCVTTPFPDGVLSRARSVLHRV